MSKETLPEANTPTVKTFSALGAVEYWPLELRRLLAEHGVDPDAFDAEFRCVGINSASGATPEAQAAIDAWIAAGGDPFAGGDVLA